MAKRFDAPAAFNPSTGAIDCSNISGILSGKVLAILDETARVFLYDIVTPGLGFSHVTGSTFFVEVDTTGLSSLDDIVVVWDDRYVIYGAVSDVQSAPFAGAVAMTMGSTYDAQRGVRVFASASGNIVLTLADGSTLTEAVYANAPQTFPYACTSWSLPGSGAATISGVYNLK